MSRFVRPETRTLTISDGDTLVVRRRLTYGEQSAQYARMYTQAADGRLRVNPLHSAMALIGAYLVDWSIRDDDGVPVAIRNEPIETVEAILSALDPASFEEIRDAINAHEQAQIAEREQEKKDRGGASASPAT